MFRSRKLEEEMLMDEGIKLANKGYLSEAIAKFDRAIELQPENGAFRYNRALAYFNADMFSKALEEFKLALRFSPNYYDGYFALGSLWRTIADDMEWKSFIFYKAYLDFDYRSEKARVAKERVRNQSLSKLDFDVKDWLSSCEKMYNNTVAKIANIGPAVLASEENDNTPSEVKAVIDNWLKEVGPSKAKQWAYPFFSNGVDLTDQRMFWAAVAQFILGLENYPYDHAALSTLGSLLASVDEFSIANQVVDFVDINKVTYDARAEVEIEIENIRRHIKPYV